MHELVNSLWKQC